MTLNETVLPEPRVYIVEDDDAVRDSLSLLLQSEGLQVAPFDSAESFLKERSDHLRGCLVLDIRMPGMNGIDLHRKLVAQRCALPVIFVTGHGDIGMAVEAMKMGAVDFVQKPYREEELLAKINSALQIDAEQAEALAQRSELRRRIESLTPRELEIMEMMVAGHANKVIAIDLKISQRTVEIHRSRVMQKMGTHSLAQLVQMVLTSRE